MVAAGLVAVAVPSVWTAAKMPLSGMIAAVLSRWTEAEEPALRKAAAQAEEMGCWSSN